jgi:hypothetical protein
MQTKEQPKEPTPFEELHPLQIIRYEEGEFYFGYKPTQLDELIKKRVIPEPKYLAPPPSRARGWTGEQILQYHRDLEAAQAERAAAAKQYYDKKPKPGQFKTPPKSKVPGRRTKVRA